MVAPDHSNFHVLTYECHDIGIGNVDLAVSKRFFILPHLYRSNNAVFGRFIYVSYGVSSEFFI